jgi:hypothetical protein
MFNLTQNQMIIMGVALVLVIVIILWVTGVFNSEEFSDNNPCKGLKGIKRYRCIIRARQEMKQKLLQKSGCNKKKGIIEKNKCLKTFIKNQP